MATRDRKCSENCPSGCVSGVVLVHMSSELDLPEERHTTLLARERLEVLVLATVRRDEVGGPTERLAALGALVRLLARVNVRVLLHVGLLVEALAAELAVERARV